MTSRRTNIRAIVVKADRNWVRDRIIEPVYKTSGGRIFELNTSNTGPYDGVSRLTRFEIAVVLDD